MILLAELYFNGGNSLKRVASDFFYSRATDSIGVKEYAGRIMNRPSLKSTAGCIVWKTKSSTSIGDIELANVDGAISNWVDFDFRDARCVLRLVNYGQSFDESVIVQVCIIDDVQREGDVVVVKLRGNETLLDRPIQPVLYDSTTAAENTSLIGNPVPIIAGRVLQFEPENIDINDLGYQASDSLVEIDTVYSGGSIANGPLESPDDYAVTDTGLVMLTQPSARITADAHTPFIPTLGVASDFYADSAWTGGDPTDWPIDDGWQSHDRVTDVGIRLVNASAETSYPRMETTLNAGNWYFVIGEIADLVSGGISIDFGDSAQVSVKRQGRFYAVGKLGTSGVVVVSALPESDVTIRFIHTYECVTGSGEPSNSENVLANILLRGGMRIDGDDVDAVPSSVSFVYRLGIELDDKDTVYAAVQKVIDSGCGYMYTDNLGIIRFGAYARPSGTPITRLSWVNMTRKPKRVTDSAPGLSTRIAALRNWSPYSENELAGITFPDRPPFMAEYRSIKEGALASSINRVYSHALSAEPIETTIINETDAQSEADRVCDIAQDKHPFWDIEFSLASQSDIAYLRPNGIVMLDDEYFDESNGKIAKIVEVDGAFGQSVYRIVTWGSEEL